MLILTTSGASAAAISCAWGQRRKTTCSTWRPERESGPRSDGGISRLERKRWNSHDHAGVVSYAPVTTGW
jgi:hypothetical protein